MPRTKRTKAYLALAERVRAINPEAAEFLMGEEIERMESFAHDAESLAAAFPWADSPQGFAYWAGVTAAL